ncbi:MAG: hypothetical protein IPI31_13765 [Bacteroidetes bacterium]|nr:hypothetical protein [Bacteroidota bacterium]
MRILLFLTVFLTLICIQEEAKAQTHLEDVVYLENGSVYRGTLLGDYPDSTVAVQILGGSIIVIPKGSIISITKEAKFDPFNTIYSPRDTGYTIFASIGLLMGSDVWGYSGGVIVDMINGYHFSDKYQAGLGLTLEASNNFFLSIYLNGRYNFKLGKNTPFLYGDFGMHTPLIDKNQGRVIDYDPGITTGLGIGIRLNSNKKQTGFIMSLGYKLSTYSIIEEDWWIGSQVAYNYVKNKALFKIGFVW